MARFVLAPDKFKNSLTAFEVCEILYDEITSHSAENEVVMCPQADGGEGTLDLLIQSLDLDVITLEVMDPLFRPILASYALSRDGKVAYIEMSRASGLPLLQPSEYKPSATSTFGTGQLINDALERGVEEVILFIGGSATNDGGMGMAVALGYQFLNQKSEELIGVGADHPDVDLITDTSVNARINDVSFIVATDVDNTLVGPHGATMVYAPQKGAPAEELESMDTAMGAFANKVEKFVGLKAQDTPGAGAAGGLGFGAMTFLKAELKPGFEIISRITGLRKNLKDADLVITGEGKLDNQSLQGKVVDGVGQLARSGQIPFVVMCGISDVSDNEIRKLGAAKVYSLTEIAGSQQKALKNPEIYLRQATKMLLTDLSH